MKKYRDCVADAYALQMLLEWLSERVDDLSSDADSYVDRADADDELCDGFYREQAIVYRAKAAAFERLLVKLSK